MDALNRDQLIAELMKHPNDEVGTDDGMVVGVTHSTYDTEDRSNVPYINLEIDEDA